MTKAMSPRNTMVVCTRCHCAAEPKRYQSDMTMLEVFLWCLCLFPGMAYSIVRSRLDECSMCRSPEIVSPSSPMGQKILREHRGA